MDQGGRHLSEPITKLRILSGPAGGKEYTVDTAESLTLGRTKSASVSLDDNLLSRQHVKVWHDDGSWWIEDLGSTNGTWIKGRRVNARESLAMRTAVTIGSTVFELFQPEVVNSDLDQSLISCRVQPLSVANLVRQVSTGGIKPREQQQLAAIYKFNSLLTRSPEERELYHEALEIVTDVIPAESAFFLKYEPKDDVLLPVAERNEHGRVSVISDTFVSRSITNYVRDSREGILSMDAGQDDRFQGESLCGISIHSVMCVPVLGKAQMIGLIYLSSCQAARVYDETDLSLLSTIAQSAGMAIENNRLLETNLRAERMAAVGVTAAGLSHYVKNILTGLEGSVSLLRVGIDESDPSLMDEAWNILSKNHKLLGSLVMDLLNLAKEDSIELAQCNFSDTIRDVVELGRQQAEEAGVELVYDDQFTGAPLVAEVDARGIHRVVLNLLNNAIAAVLERHGTDGGRIAVDLRTENNGQIVVIEISDNGNGIPEDMLDKVFEMFHTSKGDYGSGLGLAVSKRIIDNHKGHIHVGSERGVGTSFTARVPTMHSLTNTSMIKRSDFLS
jgi:signal transduction histidine kinase